MCPETKDRCLFILKWRVSNTRKGMCSLPKLPVKQNAHVLTSAFLYYFLKQSKKKKKPKTKQNKPSSATGNIGIFFSAEVHFWNVSLFNFYKVRGPQTLTNELHYTQDSTYLLWQSVSLEEWYLHMRGKNTRIKIPILSSGFCHISS